MNDDVVFKADFILDHSSEFPSPSASDTISLANSTNGESQNDISVADTITTTHVDFEKHRKDVREIANCVVNLREILLKIQEISTKRTDALNLQSFHATEYLLFESRIYIRSLKSFKMEVGQKQSVGALGDLIEK
eukprot:319325_1